MRKRRLLYIILATALLSLIFAGAAFAKSGASISCQVASSAAKGGDLDVGLKISVSEASVEQISFDLQYDTRYMSYKSYSSNYNEGAVNKVVQDKTNDELLHVLWTGSDESTFIGEGETLLFTPTFEVKKSASDGTASFEPSNVKVVLAGEDSPLSNVGAMKASTVVKSVFSTNNDLSKIEISDGTLSPSFSKNTTSYTVNVANSVTTISITGTPDDANASIVSKPVKNATLNTGNNVFSIKVRAESGAEKTYTVNVNRAKSSVNTLTSLDFSTKDYQISPAFEPSQTNYSVIVPYSVDTLSISGKLTSDVSTAEWIRQKTLTIGSNSASITVTAENGDKKTYSFTIVRLDASHDSALEAINIVGDEDNEVSPVGTTFSVNVPSTTSSTAINLITKAVKVKSINVFDKSNNPITMNGTIFVTGTLAVGDNTFRVRVTAEDAVTVTEYTIVVNRAKSDDNTLKYLRYQFGADKEELSVPLTDGVFNYTIDGVLYEQQNIIFRFEKNYINASLSGENAFTSGSVCTLNQSEDTVFLITVISESGKSQAYSITVKKAPPSTECTLTGIVPKTLDGESNEKTYTQADYWFGMDEEFNYVYRLVVGYPEEMISFGFNTTHAFATAVSEVSDYQPLTAGEENVFTVTVTAQDGVTTMTYKLIVTREAPSDDASLAGIAAVDGELTEVDDLLTEEIEYKVIIPYEIEKTQILYELNDPTATARFISEAVADEDGMYQVEIGESIVITLEVTAQNGDVVNYVVTVERECCDDNTLKSFSYVKAGAGEPVELDLTADELEIRILYGESVDCLTFFYEQNHETATVAEFPVIGEEELVKNQDYYSQIPVTVTVTAQNGETRDYVIYVRKELPSSDNKLKKLLLSTGDINFAPDTKLYKLQDFPYSISEFGMFPVQNDPSATITVRLSTQNGETEVLPDEEGSYLVMLSTGNNTVEVIVTAENGTTRKYSIVVYRTTPEINNDLVSLAPTTGSFNEAFSQYATSYTMYVPYLTEKIGFNYKVRNAFATAEFFEYVEGERTKVVQPEIGEEGWDTFDPERPLAVGSNRFEITVTAQNGLTKTYVISVTRESPSVDSTLFALEPDEGELSPEFDPSVTEYTMEVGNKISTINFSYLTTDEKSICTVTCSNESGELQEAKTTTFTFTVNAENGNTTVYTVNVYRRAKSGNATLEFIRINNSDLEFDPNVFEYDVRVLKNATNTFNLQYEASDPDTAVVTISSDSRKLIEDIVNDYSITVTAENGESHTYLLHITLRSAEDDSTLKSLYDDKGIIEFDPEITEYYYEVPFNVSELGIEYELNGEFSTEVHNFPQKLNAGEKNDFVITVTAENGNRTTYRFSIFREYKSRDSSLKSLTIENYEFTPEFDSETMFYYVSIPYAEEMISISYETGNEFATVTENFPEKLETGAQKNTFELTVTAENGMTSVYTIYVYRDLISSDCGLTGITVEGGTLAPAFDLSVSEYSATVPYAVSTPKIKCTPSDQFAKIKIEGNETLEVGENIYVITVTAQDGTTAFYSVNITRLDMESDSSLKNVAIRNCDFKFDPDITEYEITVENKIKEAIFDYKPSSLYASAKFGGYTGELEVGVPTEFTITVTAENGEVTVYRFTVTRAPLSNDTGIKTLTVNGKGIDFTKPYNVAFGVSTVNINVVPNEKHAKAELEKEYLLEVGENEITFTVTAEDLSVETYTVIIVRSQGSDNAFIKSLVPKVGKLDNEFSKDVMRYRMTVPNSVSEIDFDIETEDKNATYSFSTQTLKVGENNVIITVISESGVKKLYYIEVFREAPTALEKVVFRIAFIEINVLAILIFGVVVVGGIAAFVWFGVVSPRHKKKRKLAEQKLLDDIDKSTDDEE